MPVAEAQMNTQLPREKMMEQKDKAETQSVKVDVIKTEKLDKLLAEEFGIPVERVSLEYIHEWERMHWPSSYVKISHEQKN